MKELTLYKFIRIHQVEYHWYGKDVVFFIPFNVLKNFTDLLGYTFLSDNNFLCVLKSDCIAITGSQLPSDLDLKECFPKEE